MTPPRLTEAEYQLIITSGQVAQAARALLAVLARHPEDEADLCRVCGEDNGVAHDPTMPCGQLQAALDLLGPAVRAVTVEKA